MKHTKNKKGFTLTEVLLALGIIVLVGSVVFSSFSGFQKSKSVISDAETVVEVFRQAKNETIASKNSNAYGVYIGANSLTIFVGPTYSAGTDTNRVIALPSGKATLTTSLSGGVNYVLFKKISGETSQNGTVTVSSSGTTNTKTVTIYKTGIVEMN